MSEETSETETSEEELYNLVFFPKIAENEDPDEVKSKLSKTLKVDLDKVEGWYIAEAPTVLLKGVAKEVAERYMDAIMQCGAACNIQASGEAGGLSLVPKTRNIDFFICPSCEYEEEVPRGTKYEQCPKCGLVIAKWEEKMREEREKEQIRRRLLRDARHTDDREEELKRKRDELERLRRLEAEIMKELGIKPPGALWRLFERYPVSISSAFGIFIIGLSTIALYHIDKYLDAQDYQALAASAPTEEIQQIAPVMAAAVELQQNGNEATVNEMAQVTTVMRGEGNQPREQIVAMAQQMMKGVDPAAFVNAAAKMVPPASNTLPGPQKQVPVKVNTDTIGGVSGIQGVEQFTPETLQQITPPVLQHGQEQILKVLGERRRVPDPLNPDVNIVVDEIDELDGSMIVDLINTVSLDQEWDLYLQRNVRFFLNEKNPDGASELSNRIKNPIIRIAALGDIMASMLDDDPTAILKLPMARVRLELDKITSVDAKAKAVLELGTMLASKGYELEPAESTARVLEMIRDSGDLYVKSYLSGRLAAAYVADGDKAKAKAQFASAINFAGQIKDLSQRISAFTRIAQRYYESRNPTLANKILSEAQILAATKLEPTLRSRAFGEIAIAQGFMGDISGAMRSINNAAVGAGKQQLMAKLAESMIGEHRTFEAQSVMEMITDELEYGRLQVRLVTELLHDGKLERAKLALNDVGRRTRLISDPSERGLILSQLGRLCVRAGLVEQGKALFVEALGQSKRLAGRKLAVNRGLVGLDQARVFMMGEAANTLEDVTESIVKDPIESEILVTKRILETMLPASVREDAIKKQG